MSDNVLQNRLLERLMVIWKEASNPRIVGRAAQLFTKRNYSAIFDERQSVAETDS